MWWNIKIGKDWKDTKVAGTTYQRLLDQCHINLGKVIHMRSAAIEYASSIGELDQAAVSTMSKHQQSQLDKVYMTELYGPLLRVMSGFKVDGNYHVPRTFIDLPWPITFLLPRLFPTFTIWQNQFRSPSGDHSKAASNFYSNFFHILLQ